MEAVEFPDFGFRMETREGREGRKRGGRLGGKDGEKEGREGRMEAKRDLEWKETPMESCLGSGGKEIVVREREREREILA